MDRQDLSRQMRKPKKQKSQPGWPMALTGRRWKIYVSAFCILLLATSAWHYLVRGSDRSDKQGDNQQQAVKSVSHADATSVDDALPTLLTSHPKAQHTTESESLDANRDGWQSEARAETAAAQLSRIAAVLIQPDPLTPASFADLVADEFSSGAIWPASMKIQFQGNAIEVRRGSTTIEPIKNTLYRGSAGFATAAEMLAGRLRGASDAHIKFKIIGVEVSPDHVAATALFEASGSTSTGTIQWNASWETRWLPLEDGRSLRLAGVSVRDAVEVTVGSVEGKLFADCTESVLGTNRSYQEQLRQGANFWLRRLEGQVSPELLVAHLGVAVGDVNGDGLEDLYVCQGGGLPNRLYFHKQDGTAIDRSADSGVDILDASSSALLVDLDNDGDQDISVLTNRAVLIFANDGKGRFTLQRKLPGRFEFSLTAADYDSDGDLDLYVCNYRPDTAKQLFQFGQPVPFHNATNGPPNAMFRNDGQWRFSDVTHESGLAQNNNRWSYAASWEDYDNDGDQDLYVANDYGHNNLYRNDVGQFHDVAKELDALDANFGMSVSWGDYNRDGWMDVYIANMYSSAGNRVMFQPQFKADVEDDRRAAFQRLARGNTLLANRYPTDDLSLLKFEDTSLTAAVTMGRWSWGSLFTDINNDGWEDLLVSNGYMTQDTKDDL